MMGIRPTMAPNIPCLPTAETSGRTGDKGLLFEIIGSFKSDWVTVLP